METFIIRDATSADVRPLARLHVETFRETHGGGPSVDVRAGQWRLILGSADPRSFVYVIEDQDDELVGFARGIPYEPGIPGYDGELNKIYLLQRFHRRGLGRRLLGHVSRRFVSLGIESMLLFGDGQNPTNGFYERLEGTRLYADNGEFHGGYGWRDLRRLAEICPID